MKKKPAPKKRKGGPEVASGSKGLRSSAPPTIAREKLAKKVETLAVEAFRLLEQSGKKLRELRPLIAELREMFMKLKPGDKIAGCSTWTAYCKQILHRTDRRIRQILEGANPASEKHGPKSLQAKVESTPPEPPRLGHVNVVDIPPEPKTVKMPEARNGEWTREMVVNSSFAYVSSVFEKAKLPDEEHNKAMDQLIERLRQEVALDIRMA
jgi:hypothetical protein